MLIGQHVQHHFSLQWQMMQGRSCLPLGFHRQGRNWLIFYSYDYCWWFLYRCFGVRYQVVVVVRYQPLLEQKFHQIEDELFPLLVLHIEGHLQIIVQGLSCFFSNPMVQEWGAVARYSLNVGNPGNSIYGIGFEWMGVKSGGGERLHKDSVAGSGAHLLCQAIPYRNVCLRSETSRI